MSPPGPPPPRRRHFCPVRGEPALRSPWFLQPCRDATRDSGTIFKCVGRGGGGRGAATRKLPASKFKLLGVWQRNFENAYAEQKSVFVRQSYGGTNPSVSKFERQFLLPLNVPGLAHAGTRKRSACDLLQPFSQAIETDSVAADQ